LEPGDRTVERVVTVLGVWVCLSLGGEVSGAEMVSKEAKGDRVTIDLPANPTGAKKLLVIVNEEWRLNQYSVVRQRRTIDGDKLVLETGAVVFDPTDRMLKLTRSLLWPYVSAPISPAATLEVDPHRPITAGSVGFEQIVPHQLLIQWRTASDCPWEVLMAGTTPLFSELLFDWTAGGVDEGSDYARLVARAKVDARSAKALPIAFNQLGRLLLGPGKFVDVPPTKADVLENLMKLQGVTLVGAATRDGLYLAPKQRGIAVEVDTPTEPDGSVFRPFYFLGPSQGLGRWEPEIRLVPIPIVLDRRDAEWRSENGSAAILPSKWINDGKQGDMGFIPWAELGLDAASIHTLGIPHLDIPCQVMVPPSPPKGVVSHLRQQSGTGVLRGPRVTKEPWEVTRIITATELRQHKRVRLQLNCPQRDRDEWRFEILLGVDGGSERRWKRLDTPAGDGFSELELEPGDSTLAYRGQRQYNVWPTATNQGSMQMGEAFRLIVLVLPPKSVRGVRSPEENRWMPRGINHSNWKWLIVTAE